MTVICPAKTRREHLDALLGGRARACSPDGRVAGGGPRHGRYALVLSDGRTAEVFRLDALADGERVITERLATVLPTQAAFTPRFLVDLDTGEDVPLRLTVQAG